jgi:4'-phosphopantetheinyl transferase
MTSPMAPVGWWAARSHALTPRSDDWLGPRERDYATSRRFTKRSSEFRVARYTAKCAARQVLGMPDDDATSRRIEVGHEPSGAPFLAVDGTAVGLQISLTDRADWAVCLLSPHAGRIGCDLELVEPRTAGFVSDYLTAHEQGLVTAASSEDQAQLTANLIWSAKESALKVLTTGLRRDTRTVEVRTDVTGTGWQPLTVTADRTVVFPGWWRRFGAYVLTVAAEQPAGPPDCLDVRPLLDAATPTHYWMRRPSAG